MSVRCFVVSDEFLRARGRTGTAGKTTNPTTQHRLQHRTRWARWNREGWRSQTHLSYAETPPGLQDGEHLSVAEAAIYLSGAKTNSARGKIQTHAFRGDGGAAKTHKCKYLKRSVPLHHCWLCLILWASTNNGKWDFFFFLSQPPKKERWKEKLTIQKTLLLFVSLRRHFKMCSAFCEEGECSTHPAQILRVSFTREASTGTHLDQTFSSGLMEDMWQEEWNKTYLLLNKNTNLRENKSHRGKNKVSSDERTAYLHLFALFLFKIARPSVYSWLCSVPDQPETHCTILVRFGPVQKERGTIICSWRSSDGRRNVGRSVDAASSWCHFLRAQWEEK